MQKVRVFGVAISIGLHTVRHLLRPGVIIEKLLVHVVRLGRLQALQHRLVIVNDAGQVLNAHLAIQRVVLVQRVWVNSRFLFDVLLLFEVYLEHFAK